MRHKLNHFATYEIVCPHVYLRYGDWAMTFADERLIKWLNWFRYAIDQPVMINNYNGGGFFSQRGYRCNLCSIVKDKTKAGTLYASAHTRFQAIDFNVRGMNDTAVRRWIENHKEQMPVNIRIEADTVGWVHVDVCNTGDSKIAYFEKPNLTLQTEKPPKMKKEFKINRLLAVVAVLGLFAALVFIPRAIPTKEHTEAVYTANEAQVDALYYKALSDTLTLQTVKDNETICIMQDVMNNAFAEAARYKGLYLRERAKVKAFRCEPGSVRDSVPGPTVTVSGGKNVY